MGRREIDANPDPVADGGGVVGRRAEVEPLVPRSRADVRDPVHDFLRLFGGRIAHRRNKPQRARRDRRVRREDIVGGHRERARPQLVDDDIAREPIADPCVAGAVREHAQRGSGVRADDRAVTGQTVDRLALAIEVEDRAVGGEKHISVTGTVWNLVAIAEF